jgi:hypothetical protein
VNCAELQKVRKLEIELREAKAKLRAAVRFERSNEYSGISVSLDDRWSTFSVWSDDGQPSTSATTLKDLRELRDWLNKHLKD